MNLQPIILMAEWQVKGLQLFAALSLLVLLHEFGHFIFAKLFKTRVEKFYLFFDFLFPFSNILPFSLFKKTVGDTTYGVGWFPLGGYVKIAGMVDESMDKEQLNQPPQPWEFRSKKAWQRLLIMLGGIIVNVLVAIIIYMGIFKYWGESYLPLENMKYGVAVDSIGKSIGFENGDKIISVDGKEVLQLKDVFKKIVYDQPKTIEVVRNNQPYTIQVPQEGVIKKVIKAKKLFITPRAPIVIDSIAPNSFAEKIGLQKQDSILSLNDHFVVFADQFNAAKEQISSEPVSLKALRNKTDTVILTGTLPESKTFGIMWSASSNFFEYKDIEYTFPQAIARGWQYTGEQFKDYFSSFKLLFTSKEVKASESIGGLGSFANQFPGEFDWRTFWSFTAFISIILAFMNLLPIPGLDGGYVIFLLWEMITGRKVNDKVMEYATTVGLILLLGLMVYGNGMDIFRAFSNK
jgi:regulator of sigma E protease